MGPQLQERTARDRQTRSSLGQDRVQPIARLPGAHADAQLRVELVVLFPPPPLCRPPVAVGSDSL